MPSNPPHDPERFYHCDCLEEGDEHDKDRFYHCDCVEEARYQQEFGDDYDGGQDKSEKEAT
jgi:hypothetical protein